MNWIGGSRQRGFRQGSGGQGRGRGRGVYPQRIYHQTPEAEVEDESQRPVCDVLELAKYLPQGHALYLQLSHQMEIDKPKPHPPSSLRTPGIGREGSRSGNENIHPPFHPGSFRGFQEPPPELPAADDTTMEEEVPVSSPTSSTSDGAYLTAPAPVSPSPAPAGVFHGIGVSRTQTMDVIPNNGAIAYPWTQ